MVKDERKKVKKVKKGTLERPFVEESRCKMIFTQLDFNERAVTV